MTAIIPTVGRKVWYYPSTDAYDDDSSMIVHPKDGVNQPLDATVIAVYADDIVNLSIFDVHGHIFCRRNVKLLADGERRPSMGRYATWMPYQVKQSARDALTGTTEKEVRAALDTITKAGQYDEVMAELSKMGAPEADTLSERIGWLVANGVKRVNTPPSPLAHYSLDELRRAWDQIVNLEMTVILMDNTMPVTQEQIHAELNRRGDGAYCAV